VNWKDAFSIGKLVISLNWQMREGSRSEAERQLELYLKKEEKTLTCIARFIVQTS
jgi:hypothetical protein